MMIVLSGGPAIAGAGDQIYKLLPANGGIYDQFGNSVSVDGDMALIGCFNDNAPAQDSGSAYLFDVNTGTQLAWMRPSDSHGSDNFGISTALSVNIAVIGADKNDDMGVDSGSAYIFDVSSGTQLAKILATDGDYDERFGFAVSISGEMVIVGAPQHSTDLTYYSGSAYLFDITDPANPVQVAELLPADGADFAEFGYSVAIEGDRALVGAYCDDDNGDCSGSAYLYDISDPANPVLINKLVPADGAEADHFGSSVAMDAGVAVVGAKSDDDNGPNSGSVYVYDAATGNLNYKLLPDDGDAGDFFGNSVEVSGNIIAVGAIFDEPNGTRSGSAYLFDADTGQQIVKVVPDDGAENDNFGQSVAVTDGIMVAGASGDNDNGFDSGSAYVFATGTNTCIADLDGDGDTDQADLGLLLAEYGNGAGGDLDGDGDTDQADLGLLLSDYNCF